MGFYLNKIASKSMDLLCVFLFLTVQLGMGRTASSLPERGERDLEAIIDQLVKQNGAPYGDAPGSYEFFVTNLGSADEARIECLLAGGDLADWRSLGLGPDGTRHFNSFIQLARANMYLWVGLSDRESEGTWVWLDGKSYKPDNEGSVYPFAMWAEGEPNNVDDLDKERGEDCAVVQTFHGALPTLVDYVCDDPNNPKRGL